MRTAVAIVALLFWVSPVFAGEIKSIKCQGGDGPNPLTDLTGNQKNRFIVYEPRGDISEFVLWEKKKAIAYRNSQGEIFQLSLASGKSYGLARATNPLSSIKDENEQYLTLKDYPVTLDTGTSPAHWKKWSHKSGLKHLYWHRFFGRDSLFSVSSMKHVVSDQQRLEVYSFSRKGVKPHLCNLYAKKGQYYHLGEGHTYPYIFLYRTEKLNDCTQLSYFKLQIEGEVLESPRCELYASGQYSTQIPGNVLEVYQFPTLMQGNHNMFVVKTDHPDKNLLWDDGVYGCRFYQFGNQEPLVLNSKQAILAVWSENRGLSLIYPRKTVNNEPVIIRPLAGLISGTIGKEHLALSDNGKELYVLAHLKKHGKKAGRKLIRVFLENENLF